jgi:hypothetical protein
VNQPTSNVECKKAQNPCQQEHDKENQKHGCNILSVTYSSSVFMSSVPARIRFWQMTNSQRMPLAQPAPAGVSSAQSPDRNTITKTIDQVSMAHITLKG